jgi:hypothetical protein
MLPARKSSAILGLSCRADIACNAVAWQPILAVRMALRATKGDENPQRPDGIRPQDAILPHKLCRRTVVFDRAGGLSDRRFRYAESFSGSSPHWL